MRRCLRQIIPAKVKLRKLADQEILKKIQAEERNKIAGLTMFACWELPLDLCYRDGLFLTP